MKDYKEMAQSVFERINKYEKDKKKKQRAFRNMLTAVIVLILTGTAVFGLMFGNHTVKNKDAAVEESVAAEGSKGENKSFKTKVGNSDAGQNNTSAAESFSENNTENSTSTTKATTQKSDSPDKYGESSGGIGGIFIPALPKDRRIIVIGEELTYEEAAEYFKENQYSIKSALGASGVNASEMKIEEKGYSHVSFTGAENKPFELKQNFRDYLVLSKGRLIAIITLVKENGKIYNTPAFGANWFDDYYARLRQYKGQELVFAYAGSLELVITPDNKYFNAMGYEHGVDFGTQDIYNMFYHEKAVYVP